MHVTTGLLWAFCGAVLVSQLATPCVAQATDDPLRLIHPNVAAKLELSDDQRAKLQQLIQERDAAIAAAPENAAALTDDFGGKMLGVLTAEQLARFQADDNEPLMFNFQEQKWDAVLNWFAKQDGAALVMDEVPPGTFSYSDTKGYTPTQAIDLLNSVLLTRGYTLIRQERMLIVIRLSDTIPLEFFPRVTLDELPSRGRFEMVSVEFNIGGRVMANVLQAVEDYIGQYGRLIPLTGSQKLLVVESAGKMQTINVLIAAVPVPKAPPKPRPPEKPPQPVFASYSIGDLDPDSTLSTIQSLVSSEQISVDSRTRLLSAFVVPGQQQAIATYLEKMLAAKQELPLRTLEIYPWEQGDGQAVGEEIAKNLPGVSARYDEGSGTLFVTATEEEQKAVQAILAKAGGEVVPADQRLKIFPVGTERVTVVAELLQSMLPSAQIVADATTGRLLVRASDAQNEQIEQFVQQLADLEAQEETTVATYPKPDSIGAEELGILQTKFSSATLVVSDDDSTLTVVATAEQHPRIKAMLDQWSQLENQSSQKSLHSIPAEPLAIQRFKAAQASLDAELTGIRFLESDVDGRLLIWGTDEQSQRVKDLLTQFAQSASEEPVPNLQRFTIEVADATLLQELIVDRFPQVTFVEDPSGNDLIVMTPTNDVEALKAWVDQLQANLPKPEVREFRSYAQEGMTIEELQSLLAGPLTTAQVTVDEKRQRLIVQAPAKVHGEIQKLIESLQQAREPSQETVLIAYPIEEVSESTLTTLLGSWLSAEQWVFDADTSKLVVVAPLPIQARVKSVLQQLSVVGEAGGTKKSLKAYPVADLDLEAVMTQLQVLWPKVSLAVDTASGKLLVTGNEAQQQEIASALERLQDPVASQAMTVKTLELRGGNLETLPAVLTQLAPEAKLSLDPVNRTLTILANPKDHTRLAEAVTQLATATQDRQTLELYPVSPDRASSLLETMQSLFPSTQVSLDDQASSLIVFADADQQQRVQQLLERLKAKEPGQGDRVMRIYRMPATEPGALAAMAAQAVPEAEVIQVDPAGPAVIWATPSDHKKLADLVEQVLSEREQDETSLKMYSLPNGQETAFATLLQQRQPTASIVLGAGTGRPVIEADELGHKTIQGIIDALAQANEQLGATTLKSHPVRLDLQTSATTAIAEALPTLTLVAGAEPGRLLTWATPEQHGRIEQIIAQLEAEIPKPPIKTLQRVALEGVPKETALRVIQQAIPAIDFLEEADRDSLTFWALADELEDAKTLLIQLQTLNIAEPTESLQVIAIDSSQADATVIRDAISEQLPASVRVEVNVATNSLLVFGEDRTLEQVKGWVQTMLAELPPPATIRSQVYRLKHASPDAAGEVLTSVLPGRTVAVDDQSRSLAIAATPDEHRLVQEFLEEFDIAVDEEARVAKIYRLNDGDAQDVAVVLSQLLPNAFFTYRSRPPLIVASANPRDIPKIEAIVDQYRSQGEGQRTTRVFDVKVADVTVLASSLQLMSPEAEIQGDVATRRIIATAGAENMSRIEQVIEQVDVDVESDRETRVYRLDADADSQDLAVVLGRLIPNGFFTYRTIPPMLLAAGMPEDLEQVDVVVKQYLSGANEDFETQVFTLQVAEASSLVEAIQVLHPQANIGADENTNTLVVAASAEELQAISDVIKQIESGGSESLETKVYRLRTGDADNLAEVLQSLVPQAVIVADSTPPTIVATADAEAHQKIDQVVQQYQGVDGVATSTRVFSLATAEADGLAEAIREISPQAVVSSDDSSNAIVVTATTDELDKIAEIVQQVDTGNALGTSTKLYTLRRGNPESLQTALQPLLPKAVFSADPESGGLFVTASAEEHEQVQQLVDDLDRSEMREPKLKAFTIRHARADLVYEAVANAMPAGQDVAVSFDPQTSTLFVVGLAVDHERAQQIIDQIDRPEDIDQNRQLLALPVQGANGEALVEAVEALFYDAEPAVVAQYNQEKEQLIVVGNSEQLEQIQESLGQFKRTTREFKVFAIEQNDPRAIEGAVRQLFDDEAPQERPAVTVDQSRGTIFVRATPEQMEKIKELLGQLGEQIDGEGQPAGRVRSIPASPRLEEALEQIQDVWPTLRPNQIKVLELNGSKPGDEPKPETKSPETRGTQGNSEDDCLAPIEINDEGEDSGNALTQDDSKLGQIDASAVGLAADAQEKSPIVVIPGLSRWTIASDDIEALDQFEMLLKSVLKQSPAAARLGNFSIYLLKNAGAAQIERLLNDLFRKISSADEFSGLGKVSLVSDERINALIVHGNLNERRTVEELLRVIDSDDLLETLESTSPQIIPILHSPVSRVSEILQSVYKTQLTSGGGRRRVSIPEGVDPTVASVLRQINAAAAGPLLTLSVDEPTNSLVVRAPIELADEIRAFVNKLDDEAASATGNRLNIIQLKGTNSTRMREAIDLLLQGR